MRRCPRMAAPVAPHLRQRPSARARRWVGQQLGGEVVATRRLKGGISTSTRAVTVERPDGTRRHAVLRTFVRDGWLTAEPDLAAREAALLEVLERAGVPAPRLLGVDADGAESGSVCLIMTLERGRPVHAPADRRRWIAGLVDAMLRVHECRRRPSRTCATSAPASTSTSRRRRPSATGCRSTPRSGLSSRSTGRWSPSGPPPSCTTTTTRATCSGRAAASPASSTGPAPGSANRPATRATCARTWRSCADRTPATR